MGNRKLTNVKGDPIECVLGNPLKQKSGTQLMNKTIEQRHYQIKQELQKADVCICQESHEGVLKTNKVLQGAMIPGQ